jgi:hypothetical protein
MSNKLLNSGQIPQLCAKTSAKIPIICQRTATAAFSGLIAGFVWPGSAPAQSPLFQELTAERLPAIAGRCMDAAAGDADGDGDLDIALAMEFEPNVLLINDGTGRFMNASDRLPRDIRDSEDVAFADFDADGDLDLVLVSEDDRIDEFYLNDGTGRFIDASDRLPTDDVSNALALIDLNGDGAPDILTGNIGVDRILLNDGGARFSDVTGAFWPQSGISRTQDIEVADVDGDGDADVIVANEGQNQLFINHSGQLADETESRLPAIEDETREIRAVDVDADGDNDLLVGNVAFLLERSAADYLLINDGSGMFVRAAAVRLPEDARSNFTVQVADLDGDDDFDVLAPSTEFGAAGTGDYLVLLNDGAGRFAAAPAGSVLPNTATGNGFDIEVADFDADGVDELLLCNRASGQDAMRSGGILRLLVRTR